jgi:hypothetical protein
MAELRQKQQAEPTSVAVFEQRGRVAHELASSLLDAQEPVSSGQAEGPVCELYRESIFWLLSALDAKRAHAAGDTSWRPAGTSADELRALWAGTTGHAGVDPAELTPVAGDFCERTFVDFAQLPGDEQVLAARRLRRAATALVAVSATTGKDIERIWNRRMLRLGSVLAVLLLVTGAAAFAGGYREKQRDIAANRPWRASSTTSYGCKPPAQTCEESQDYFFHTADEARPWVELDLGSVRKIAGVRVENRKDCCAERAVPLVLEVSNDQNHFREIARKDDTFHSWKVDFPPIEARYVRLAVNRRTILHLAQVRVLRP